MFFKGPGQVCGGHGDRYGICARGLHCDTKMKRNRCTGCYARGSNECFEFDGFVDRS